MQRKLLFPRGGDLFTYKHLKKVLYFVNNRTFGSSELTKQQSLTAWSPTPPTVSGSGHIIKQHSLSPATSRYLYHQQSMSRSSCCQVSKSPSPVSCSKNSYGSARFLPKQYSCTSNSSAYLSPQVRIIILTYLNIQKFYKLN